VRLDYFHFNYLDKLTVDQQPSQHKTIVSPKLNVQYTINRAVQLYVKGGKGFHSNDTRVVTANLGKEILPAAYGADLGIILKPTRNLYINVAAWYLHLAQEFVYVGDDGNIEPSGKTKRQGLDIIARYQFTKNLFANANINFTKPRAIGEKKGEDYIPLAPTATSTGGLFYKAKQGFNGGLTYRYIQSRPANEDNTVIAKGYFLLDASVNYTKPRYEIGLALENIFNAKWNEAQFATGSRLKNELAPVTELNYTPGTPFFARVKLVVFF
jgi:TonB dependent receptor